MSLTDPHHPWHHPAAAAAAISAAAAQQQHAQDQHQQQQQHGRGNAGTEGATNAGEKSSTGFFGALGRASAGASAGGSAAAAAHHGNPFLAAAAAQHSAMGLGPLGSLGAKAEQLRTSMAAQQHSGMSNQPAPFR